MPQGLTTSNDEPDENLPSLATLSLRTESHCDSGDNRLKPRPPFALLESVPTELVLEIIRLSGGQWQSAYRALLLTCKRISALARMECPSLLPILITTKKQGFSFLHLVQSDYEFASQVTHLWLIGKVDDLDFTILARCTSLVSLACRPQILERWEFQLNLIPMSFVHRKIKHLTVLERFPHTHLLLPVYEQLETFHLIGGSGGRHTFLNHAPKLKNITQVSFSLGTNSVVQAENFLELLQSPKLVRIAFLTRSRVPSLSPFFTEEMIALLLRGKSYTIVRRRKRWTESKVWRDGIWDRDSVWKMEEAGRVPG